jgi:ferric-dicitrate binding protein FerR (iron transport regulator)
MSRQEFHQLLVRYLDGKCTDAEKRIVEQWYGMLDDESLPARQPVDLNQVEQQLWEKVQADMQEHQTVPVFRHWRRIAVAAVLTGVMAVSGYLLLRSNGPEAAMASMLQKENNGNTPLKMTLEDGSQVVLQPGASLSYPAHFAQEKRDVTLKGDGFFNISKDAVRPFRVYSNEVVIHVLGTSFTVTNNVYTHKTEVTVQTGKVAVSQLAKAKESPAAQPAAASVVITPNQRVIYDAVRHQLESTLAAAPVPVITPPSFVYSENKLRTVLQQMEAVYGIQIVAENKNIANCTFTGDISGQGLYDKIDLVCKSIGASYQLKGMVVYVKGGKSCD